MQTSTGVFTRRLGAMSHHIRTLCSAVLLMATCLLTGTAMAHGDVVPQSVNTTTLPPLGEKWLPANPYSEGPAQQGGTAHRNLGLQPELRALPWS